MIDNTNPAHLEDEAISQEIARLQGIGDLQMNDWTKDSRPSSGWTIEAYQQALDTRRSTSPQFPGAKSNMNWMEMAKSDIGGAEGNEPFAYHGSLSAERKAGKFRVTNGDNVAGHEVSVGFGFNLTQNGGRQLFEQALAGKDAPSYDDVLNGRKAITPAHADSLQEYMILQKNGILERMLGGAPVQNHQRAALLSMLYQGVNVRPVIDAMKSGAAPEAVAKLIENTGDRKFATRRKYEASRFMGAGAAGFFDNSTNALPGRVAQADVNPRERH